MKFRLFVCLTAVMFLLSGSAWAFKNGGPYVALKGTASFTDVEEMLDNSGSKNEEEVNYGFGGAVGFNFADFDFPVRVEAEYMYRTDVELNSDIGNSTAKREINIQTVFANVFIDLYNSTNFVPYLAGGVGFASIDTDFEVDFGSLGNLIDDDDSESEFVWNIGAGVAYNFSESFIVDLGYRFSDMREATVSDLGYKADLETHEVILGLRYQF